MTINKLLLFEEWAEVSSNKVRHIYSGT